MVSDDLLNYIRVQQAQGYTPSQIKSFLKKNGYANEIIEEHFKKLFHSKQPLKPIIVIVAIIGLLILIGGIVFASWYFSQPVCGNGELEEGETPDNCCVDASCGDGSEYECIDNQCIAPTCGECELLIGNSCQPLDCCNDNMCEDGEYCKLNNKCDKVLCGFCQYVDGHSCSSYECCEDAQCLQPAFCVDYTCQTIDCDTCQYVSAGECVDYACCVDTDCSDEDNATVDICSHSGTLNSFCSNVLPPKCESRFDCDDEDDSTKDTCEGEPLDCVHEVITECKHRDGFCPTTCDYSNDDDCEEPDECSVDVDCDDDKESTKDTCEDEPKECKNRLIIDCIVDDGYCPINCNWESDDDCEFPEGDLSVGNMLSVQSYGVDNQFHPTDCAREQVLVFNVTHNFSLALTQIPFQIYVDDVLLTKQYSSVPYLREVGSSFDTTFSIGTTLSYVEFKGSVAGKDIRVEVDSGKLEYDGENNGVSKLFHSQEMDLMLGPQIYDDTNGRYYVEVYRHVEIEECPPFKITAYDGLLSLSVFFGGFEGLIGQIEVTHDSSSMNITVDSTNMVNEPDENNNVQSY